MDFSEVKSIAWRVFEEITGLSVTAAFTGSPSASTFLRGDGVWSSTLTGPVTGTSLVQTGANGQSATIQQLTELTTIAAAATTDTAIQMPAGAIVLAVSVRVTVLIPTAATFTVGDSGSAARFSTAAVLVAAGTTNKGTKAGAYYNAGALAVRITPDVQPANNSGRVRTTIHYLSIVAPTS